LPDTDLVLGLLDRGLPGLAVLVGGGLCFVIWKLMGRRTTLAAQIRTDLVEVKGENRSLEARLDEERSARRRAEDALHQHLRWCPDPQAGPPGRHDLR